MGITVGKKGRCVMAIEKSYIDMLKERDAKIEALKELLRLSHESLDSKDKKIAELEKERKWIDVIKELPKTTMSVLVTNGAKVGELTYVKYVNGTGKWAGNNEDITAWMLKPKSPETLKEQE
jgi:hypothetical protein